MQALGYCDEQSHAMHRNFYQQRIWQKLAYGRALAATGNVRAARASLEQAAALAAERRVLRWVHVQGDSEREHPSPHHHGWKPVHEGAQVS